MNEIKQLKEEFVAKKAFTLKLREQLAEYDKKIEEQIFELTKDLRERHRQETDEIATKLLEADQETRDIEDKLRQMAIDHYNETGEKSLDENLSVRVTKFFDYDMKEALAWAKENAPILIVQSIDKKKFEKFAPDCDFVTIDEKVSSVIKGL